MDLQTIDNVFSTSSIPFNYKHIDKDEEDVMNENIQDQYINFNNLGVNLLQEIKEPQIKLNIIKDLIQYVNNEYTSVVNFESLFVRDIEEIGCFTYEFFCIDCYNILFPKYIASINCSNRQEFENVINNQYNVESYKFKNSFILIIKSYLNQMFKLSKLDPKIKDDKQYNNMIKKFSYYIDLMEFGLSDKFINNYIFPLVNKHFEELYWRSN